MARYETLLTSTFDWFNHLFSAYRGVFEPRTPFLFILPYPSLSRHICSGHNDYFLDLQRGIAWPRRIGVCGKRSRRYVRGSSTIPL